MGSTKSEIFRRFVPVLTGYGDPSTTSEQRKPPEMWNKKSTEHFAVFSFAISALFSLINLRDLLEALRQSANARVFKTLNTLRHPCAYLNMARRTHRFVTFRGCSLLLSAELRMPRSSGLVTPHPLLWNAYKRSSGQNPLDDNFLHADRVVFFQASKIRASSD